METENMKDDYQQQDFNEWGKYTGNKDLIKLEGDDVIRNILGNNPAISSVQAVSRVVQIPQSRLSPCAIKLIGN